jgi:hypothetical protein
VPDQFYRTESELNVIDLPTFFHAAKIHIQLAGAVPKGLVTGTSPRRPIRSKSMLSTLTVPLQGFFAIECKYNPALFQERRLYLR